MIHEQCDVAVLGAGFAGSIMASVLQRLGLRAVLIERGRHPRFTIGESSTPLANLALEELSRTYDLPHLWPLTEYGRWKRAYPQLVCGLKRGFTFYQHHRGEEFRPHPDHANELLVAASPNDEVSDTHWFREHFDQFLMEQARAAGVPYYDETKIAGIERRELWELTGRRGDEPVRIDAALLIDATGPGGILARAFDIDTSPVDLATNCWTVYSHFAGMDLWENLLLERGGRIDDHPYRCDDAALHHVLDDGWMWQLRFENGLTSVGFAVDGTRLESDPALSPEAEWQKILDFYPAIGRQLRAAQPVRPFTRTGRLQRRARRAAGDSWVMLPHAAYFLDPLFSPGMAHSLLGILRLADILKHHWGRDTLAAGLAEYEAALFREVQFIDWIIHGCYRTFRHFDLFAAYSMYYFAGAIHQETVRRQRGWSRADEFLFSDDPSFRAVVERAWQTVQTLTSGAPPPVAAVRAFERQVAEDIAPINHAGLCESGKRNMYPFV